MREIETEHIIQEEARLCIEASYYLGEDVLAEFDEEGHLVSMTIEHAQQQTDLREFSYQLANAKSTGIAE